MSADSPPARGLFSRRRLRLLLLLLIALVLIRVSLPALIRWAVEWQGPAQLGVPVRLANVDLGLLRGHLVLEGLQIGGPPDAPASGAVGPEPAAVGTDPDGAGTSSPSDVSEAGDPPDPAPASADPDPGAGETLARWTRVELELDWPSLFRREANFRSIGVDAPFLRLERTADGRIVLPFPVAGGGEAGAPAEPPAATGADADPSGAVPEVEVAEEADAEAAPEAQVGEAEVPDPDDGWWVRADQLRVGEVRVVVVDRKEGEVRYVEMGLAALRLGDFSLAPDGAIGFGAIDLVEPVLRVRQEVATGPGAEAEEPAPAGAAPDARVERLAIEGASFTLLTAGDPLEVTLDLAAEGITTAAEERFPIDLRLAVAGGSISLAGDLGLFPPSFDGRLELAGVQLLPLAASAQPDLAPWLGGGALAAELDLKGRLDDSAAAAAHVSGQLSVSDLRFEQPVGQEVGVAWKGLRVDLAALDVPLGPDAGPPRAQISKVALAEPALRYTLPATALDALFGSQPEAEDDLAEPPDADAGEVAAAAPEPAEAGAAPEADAGVEVEIAQVEIDGGRVDFEDRSVEPVHTSRLEQLTLRARDLRWPSGEAAHFDLKARLPGNAPFHVVGAYEPGAGHVDVNVRKLALRPFNPYASGAGLRVDQGRASLVSRLRIRGERYEADNELMLHKLELSSPGGGGIFGVSVDVALALLRDIEGNIALPVPVEADAETVRTGTGTILLAALKQALLAALQSPLKLVGGVAKALTGGGALGAAPLETEPGALTPRAGHEDEITALANLLASRPGLALEIRGRTGEADHPIVAERILREKVLADEDLPPLPDSSWFERRRLRNALRERAEGGEGALEPADEALLERWIASLEIPPERLDRLAAARAEGVRDALGLGHGVPLERLHLGAPAEPGPPGIVLQLGVDLPAVSAP